MREQCTAIRHQHTVVRRAVLSNGQRLHGAYANPRRAPLDNERPMGANRQWAVRRRTWDFRLRLKGAIGQGIVDNAEPQRPSDPRSV